MQGAQGDLPLILRVFHLQAAVTMPGNGQAGGWLRRSQANGG